MKTMILIQMFVVALGGVGSACSQDNDDRTAIAKAVVSYVAAFNGRDAKALAALWSPGGVYISRTDGEEITGREALQKQFAAQFEEMGDVTLKVTSESLEFISPNVALERGTATVIRPEAEPSGSTYSAVYVKREGRWLIDRVSEEETLPVAPSHHAKLKQLEWMVGEWVDRDGGNVIKTECQWTRNKNFLRRSFTASVEDRVNITGMQFVGWDPARKQIRSWLFDSDGGVAEGVWSPSKGRWLVQTTATLPDGTVASSTSILRPLGAKGFTWQKVNRIVDGEILPNIDEVMIVRQ